MKNTEKVCIYCSLLYLPLTVIIIEAEKFLDEANESLKNELKHVPFNKVHDIIKESTFELGGARNNMEQCLAKYCNTTTSDTSMITVITVM